MTHSNRNEPQRASGTVRRFVGPFLFFFSMIAVLAIGDQLDSITWRQMVSLSAFPLITGYAAYACGFINGHHEGYMKSEDEHRPNTVNLARESASVDQHSVVGIYNNTKG